MLLLLLILFVSTGVAVSGREQAYRNRREEFMAHAMQRFSKPGVMHNRLANAIQRRAAVVAQKKHMPFVARPTLLKHSASAIKHQAPAKHQTTVGHQAPAKHHTTVGHQAPAVEPSAKESRLTRLPPQMQKKHYSFVPHPTLLKKKTSPLARK